MKADVILGLQWGDEGKGKIVDFLAANYQVVARFQGGPNAGHTLQFDHIKHVLHQVPSGIFRPDIKNVIGNGVVLDPVVFRREIDGLKQYGVEPFYNLYLSKRTQLILPTHRLLDAAYEHSAGHQRIGSTLRGIGPAYQDKIARSGVRLGDIVLPLFEEKYQRLRKRHIDLLNHLQYSYDLAPMEAEFFDSIEFLKKFKLIDTDYFINQCLQSNEAVLAEGAQGSLLDIDFGSYPFVTSSNTTCAGVCTGLGLPPSRIGKVYGIFKAYCTRVGEGPFPTELVDETGDLLRQVGMEFGATTGRPRRCGWLDLPALKYAIMVNGVSSLIMMKADVLSAFDEIKICTHYKMPDGAITDNLPFDLCQTPVTPVYQSMEGWRQAVDQIHHYHELPKALQRYVSYIEQETGLPISILSTGPNRSQTIFRHI
jgi:adenylosuccinate synthase